MFGVIIFILGICVGSFLNCVIYRLNSTESFLRGYSFCPYCKHRLGFCDLIPVLSFIFLKGKCRYCGKKISLQYPLVEIATAVLFLLIFLRFTIYDLPFTVYLLIISCFLIVIFVYDLKHYLIPDKVIYPAILVSCIWYLVSGIFFEFYTKYEILNTIYAAFGASGFFFFIWAVSRGRWMGFGDVKLAFLMGLFLGWPDILVGLFSAFLIGAIIGIGLIVLGKKSLRSQVPFAPFLVLGTFIGLFLGKEIISWYLNLIISF